ncbi:MAG: Na(+)-translocating NADH-quinone reductase subunit A [Candidatus Marinimicrobia bacterium]|nr:Na(+)-translocating NADH-quinone reductase subunit A [Candidatus Neomarinimicrobiota bacterium]
MNIHIRKGHDLKLVGAPAKSVQDINDSAFIKLHPSDFPGVKPKLLVKVGETLKKGQAVFNDKNNPNILFTSPNAGIVEDIYFGERRRIEFITIRVDENAGEMSFDQYALGKIYELDPTDVTDILCKSGLWPALRRRPFSKIAIPHLPPKAIFISTMSTAPFAADLEVILDKIPKDNIQAGINVLQLLTTGSVNLVSPKKVINSKLSELQNIQQHTYSGPHPSGNVGIHVSQIDPIKNKDDSIWYISIQDVGLIGNLFLTGKQNYRKIITVAGSSIADRMHYSVNRGTLISDILSKNKVEKDSRIISGDVLSGSISKLDNAIGYYHESLTVIPDEINREFLGWIGPGLSKYSLSYTFLSTLFPKREKVLSTAMNGGKRAILPIGAIEKVMPLDILPTMLLKSIIANDIETMEQLGIYECDPEDFALCSFTDASKMDITGIIQDGLNLAEAEG